MTQRSIRRPNPPTVVRYPVQLGEASLSGNAVILDDAEGDSVSHHIRLDDIDSYTFEPGAGLVTIRTAQVWWEVVDENLDGPDKFEAVNKLEIILYNFFNAGAE